jgi:hypothetical protein
MLGLRFRIRGLERETDRNDNLLRHPICHIYYICVPMSQIICNKGNKVLIEGMRLKWWEQLRRTSSLRIWAS